MPLGLLYVYNTRERERNPRHRHRDERASLLCREGEYSVSSCFFFSPTALCVYNRHFFAAANLMSWEILRYGSVYGERWKTVRLRSRTTMSQSGGENIFFFAEVGLSHNGCILFRGFFNLGCFFESCAVCTVYILFEFIYVKGGRRTMICFNAKKSWLKFPVNDCIRM